MKNKQFYDLDGTLSKYNNTFDFIFWFLYKRKKWRYYFGKIAIKIINKTKVLTYTQRRKLMILTLFYGTKKEDLASFFENEYKEAFLKNLTKLGNKILDDKDKGSVLLTGCTEIPAKQISRIFGFEKVICTTFNCKNDYIVGIKDDTFGNFKLGYVNKKNNDYFTYYTDDIKSENELKKIMDNIILVKKNEI